MFIKITHNNQGDARVAIVNVKEIVSVGEKHQEPSRLYDELGNLVEERKPTTKLYRVVLKNGFSYNIDETEYTRIEKVLLSITD